MTPHREKRRGSRNASESSDSENNHSKDRNKKTR